MSVLQWVQIIAVVLPIAIMIFSSTLYLERRMTRMEDGLNGTQNDVKELKEKGMFTTLCDAFRSGIEERLERLDRRVFNGGKPP